MSPDFYASLLAAAVFIAILALGALIALTLTTRVERRLQVRLRAHGESDDQAIESPLLKGFARSGRWIESTVDSQGEVAQLLLQAGWRDSQSRLMYYALQAALPLLFGIVLLVMWIGGAQWLRGSMLFAALFVAIALSYLIPINVLRRVATARKRRIDAEVPLFVHLLVLLFEAGLSTRQAFMTIAREGHGTLPELGEELEFLVRQIDAGGDSAQAMKSLAEAQGVEDLSSLFAILRQVDRYGGEVREPLLDMLKTIEDRRSMEVREKVNRLSGQMTVVMVLFFFPALIIFVAGPAFASIFKMFRSLH